MRSITHHRLVAATAALVGLSLVATACGDDADAETTASTQTRAADTTGSRRGGQDLSGHIVISGSSTVEPISTAVADEFDDLHPGVQISVDGPGTGDGFVLFCNGETDINDASSKIKPEQEEACAENGIELIELRIGSDGIAIMTNAANDAVE